MRRRGCTHTLTTVPEVPLAVPEVPAASTRAALPPRDRDAAPSGPRFDKIFEVREKLCFCFKNIFSVRLKSFHSAQ